MAFTAVHYPTNKDHGQLSYWPDSEELGVASDNLFDLDQFVTFDTDLPGLDGDLLENPPSPSIMLEDTLSGALTNSSSNDQDTQPGQSQTEQPPNDLAIASELLGLSSVVSIPDHSQSVPPELSTPLFTDPVLSGGSNSDSELLRLEGISIKSPKPNATVPSTPPFPNTSSQPPRKHSRVLDSIFSTFRKVTHRSRPQKSQDHSQMDTDGAATLTDAFKRDETTCYDLPGGLDWKDFADIKLEEMPVPVDNLGLPLSPPLTGRIPPDQHSSSTMNFVRGDFDDPFVDGLLGPPATIHPEPKSHDMNLNTPITPGLNDDPFYQNGMNGMGVLDTNGHSFRSRPHAKQRSTSSAEWPMEGILTNDNTSVVWPPSEPGTGPTYVPDGVPSPEWWDTATPHTTSHHRNGHHRYHNGMHSNASLNLSMHNQQADLSYEYANSADLSGLMIHMPQPRVPQAAVLNPGIHDALMSPSTGYYPTPSSSHQHPSSSHNHHRSSSSGHPHGSHHHSERRPRPRAPSSGARHHGSMTSLRKMSSCYALREESMSPTPHHPRHRSASSSSSSALAVRKRRSWTRRSQQQQQQEPQTPSSRSVSYEGHGSMRRGSGGRHEEGGGGGESGGGGAFSIEFCNYTPNDKKVLMNGVAPSGSSKTKARREKEAMEHKRQMSEAYIQAIRAAGGDVEKLRQNGFFEQRDSD
ncbi:hypothetical protein F4818DRAFT_306340 [Hypoxylon cercidicola]|nr:hypothetical protein F4818DRAFT_306340 [Hypoxylon cercidicola]